MERMSCNRDRSQIEGQKAGEMNWPPSELGGAKPTFGHPGPQVFVLPSITWPSICRFNVFLRHPLSVVLHRPLVFMLSSGFGPNRPSDLSSEASREGGSGRPSSVSLYAVVRRPSEADLQAQRPSNVHQSLSFSRTGALNPMNPKESHCRNRKQ
jgi:hypothetical protein